MHHSTHFMHHSLFVLHCQIQQAAAAPQKTECDVRRRSGAAPPRVLGCAASSGGYGSSGEVLPGGAGCHDTLLVRSGSLFILL